MAESYTASDIEVLSGLDPVRRRPGMYTDTTRPNHLAHEVIDNSVDEAIAGHCRSIQVTLYRDHSLEVADDGRGMPIDIHPKEKVSGVELILTRLHAGGKFTEGSYKFSGGLHGVGVSVVNALSRQLECSVRRGGREYHIGFRDGRVHAPLKLRDRHGRRAQYRHHGALLAGPEVLRLRPLLGARPATRPQGQGRAVPGPAGQLPERERPASARSGSTPATSAPTCSSSCAAHSCCPRSRSPAGTRASRTWSSGRWCGRADAEPLIAESYVNLIPTTAGGTHVNGLRAGVVEAVREFCEFRNLLPRGVKLTRRGRLESRLLRALGQDARPAVRGPDQGEAQLARGRDAGRDASRATPRHCGSTSIRTPASASRSSRSPTRRSGCARPRGWCASAP